MKPEMMHFLFASLHVKAAGNKIQERMIARNVRRTNRTIFFVSIVHIFHTQHTFLNLYFEPIF